MMFKPDATAKRGTVLNGVLFRQNKNRTDDTVMIAITGIHGNFYSNPFYYNIEVQGKTGNRPEPDGRGQGKDGKGCRADCHPESDRSAFLSRHFRRGQRGDQAHDHCPAGGANCDQPRLRGRDQVPHQRRAVHADRGIRAWKTRAPAG